jgi:hypothetical protein
MTAQPENAIQITVDGRTIVAQPRPEDQAVLAELLASSGGNITLQTADFDTEGHVLAAGDVEVDVEGHAMTLRLPNTADAEALRKALAIGALSASLAIGGFAAGSWAQSQAQAATGGTQVTTQTTQVTHFDRHGVRTE